MKTCELGRTVRQAWLLITACAISLMFAGVSPGTDFDDVVVSNSFHQEGMSYTNYFKGNLGVGTSNPAEKMHVVGNLKVDGAIKGYGSAQFSSLSVGDSSLANFVMWNKMESYTNGTCESYIGDDLSITGAPQVVTAQYGNGLQTSTNNNFYVGYDSVAEGCIEFWYKTPSSYDRFECVFWGWNDHSFFLSHAAVVDGSWDGTGWNLAMWDTGYGNYIQTTRVAGRPTTSTWYHVAVVWSTNGIALYLNGQNVGSASGTPDPPNQNLYFGVEQISGNWGSAKVFDNMKIWNYAKTNFDDRTSEGSAMSTNITIADVTNWNVSATGTVAGARISDGSVSTGKLDVVTVDARYVNIAGDTMSGTLQLPANGLVVSTNQLVATGGRIGVGTSSPSEQFHVINKGRFDGGISFITNLGDVGMGVYTNGP